MLTRPPKRDQRPEKTEVGASQYSNISGLARFRKGHFSGKRAWLSPATGGRARGAYGFAVSPATQMVTGGLLLLCGCIRREARPAQSATSGAALTAGGGGVGIQISDSGQPTTWYQKPRGTSDHQHPFNA